MTVTITQNMQDIGGIPDDSPVWFWQADRPRAAADGVAMVTTRQLLVTPVDGVLTVQLEPGPAWVRLGILEYSILVPDIDATLWPLVAAGMPAPPTPGSDFVRNFGGIRGMLDVTQSWYDANPHDPDTLYVVFPE